MWKSQTSHVRPMGIPCISQKKYEVNHGNESRIGLTNLYSCGCCGDNGTPWQFILFSEKQLYALGSATVLSGKFGLSYD